MRTTTTRDISEGRSQKFFLYGLPGSGKTHFAGTFPNPVFVTPEASLNELHTLALDNIPVVPFKNIQEFADVVIEVVDTVLRRKPIGGYIPQTLVLDNLTELQNMIEHEVLGDPNKRGGNLAHGVKLMGEREWGVMRNVCMHVRTEFYRALKYCHIIWIAHAVQRTSTKNEKGRVVETEYGSYALKGDARRFFPNNAHILYMEAITRGKQMGYYLHATPHGIWPARIHFPAGKQGFTRIGTDLQDTDTIHPHYDDIAPYFGLSSQAECEGLRDITSTQELNTEEK